MRRSGLLFVSSLLAVLGVAAPRAAVGSAEGPEALALRVGGRRHGHRLGRGHQGVRGQAPRRQGEVRGKGFEQIQQTRRWCSTPTRRPTSWSTTRATPPPACSRPRACSPTSPPGRQERGWDKLLSPSLQTTGRYDDKGVMGSGKWYGVPNYGEYVMVYYNKDLFKKYGREGADHAGRVRGAPWTPSRRPGVTPLALRRRRVPRPAVFYELALTKADRAFVDAYELYKGKVDFHGPEFTYARRAPSRTGSRRATSPRTPPAQGRGHGRSPSSAASTRSWSPAAGGTAASRPRSRASSGARSCSRATSCTPARAATSGSCRQAPRTRSWPTTSSTSR